MFRISVNDLVPRDVFELVNGGRARQLHNILLDDTRIGGDRLPLTVNSLDDGRLEVEARGEVGNEEVHAGLIALLRKMRGRVADGGAHSAGEDPRLVGDHAQAGGVLVVVVVVKVVVRGRQAVRFNLTGTGAIRVRTGECSTVPFWISFCVPAF